jgi:hypothetical protein
MMRQSRSGNGKIHKSEGKKASQTGSGHGRHNFQLKLPRGCIQSETWGMGTCSGADYNFTLTHSRARCAVAHFFNMLCMSTGEGGGKGWELTLCLRINTWHCPTPCLS